ncbi:thiosulfate sulfurtransferase-like isoform X1 [Mercenaria mercenaria]|uniref:thiosulfate sulfurtransferase-like isoform X1 n=1 Tax=Mercenaria mercenaria TaxID=6596 RepID=UPI00234E9A23|nr:thiosulfate sulfurtransferase-like isoform X1 [Mercenaria mercenaria]XP_053377774.1 thiosulfate sulfurtransferase-like isoform X1 [Mercenaria mercenaria]
MASAGKPTLVSSEWLHDQLKNNKGVSRSVRILDTTFDRYRKLDTYKDCYLKEHVPTALFFDLHKCVQSTSEIPRNLPEANSFTEYVRSLGVWPDTHVIVYDRDDLVPAFRTWWLFRLYGHKNVSILDGGLEKWKANGYEIASDIPDVERSNFSINMNKTLLHSYEDMFDNVAKSKNRQIVDSRMKNDPKMIDLAIDGGIIPNSKIVSYTDLFNEDQTMKSPPMLKALFDVAGVDTCSPMVVTCNTGMTACCVAAAMHILGQDIPVYYGSWTEWRQRAPEELKQRVNADD